VRVTAALLCLLALPACAAPAPAPTATPLTLATWNAEWLLLPQDFDELMQNCVPSGVRAGGSERAVYCNLGAERRWNEADLDRLAGFAATIDADVIALQETDGVAAARRLFPEHEFCFTARQHVQNVGFAIRRGLPHRCNDDYRALGLANNDVRWGADITLFPGTAREIRLLAVHLKAGCAWDPLNANRDPCRVLSQQVPVLEAWIDARAAEGTHFAVLGDFNRQLGRERAPARDEAGRMIALWPEIDDGDPPGANLTNAGAAARPVVCRPGDPLRPPIDHLVLGETLAAALVDGSYRMWPYPTQPAGARWPDHCIFTVTIDTARLGE
jgi:endonuclease/exonuclease/phosphatase family metal-dependent hydrolase